MGNSASTSTTSLERGNFVSTSNSQGEALGMTRVNDTVWILHEPSTGTPSMDIIFFHGLHLGDYGNAFWQTWVARGDESVIWPKHWLGKEFPHARILSISYNASLEENSGQLDMYCLGENFVSNIIMDGLKIGQSCPIILVGHCLGGIVLKQFILSAQRIKVEEGKANQKVKIQEGTACNNQRSNRIDAFFENLKGVFYYGTPHGGSDITKFAKLIFGVSSKYIQLLAIHDKETTRVRMNEEFRKFRDNYNVRAFGMGEGVRTTRLGFHGFVVPDSSARCDIDSYYTAANADHFNVCQPENMTSGIFKELCQFISDMTSNEIVPKDDFFENKQHLRVKTVGLDRLVNVVEDEEGARDDAREALKFPVRVHPYDSPTRSLGLEGIEEWKKQAMLMLCQAQQQAMEKVRASELVGALAALDVVRPHLLEECRKSFFFQERGVLKRLLGDLVGALEDLTDALEIIVKDHGEDYECGKHREFGKYLVDDLDGGQMNAGIYECRKHRGFVKYLLGDLDGARTDAERAMAIMPNDCEEWKNTMEVAPGNRRFLGNDPVEFLGFTLPPRT